MEAASEYAKETGAVCVSEGCRYSNCRAVRDETYTETCPGMPEWQCATARKRRCAFSGVLAGVLLHVSRSREKG